MNLNYLRFNLIKFKLINLNKRYARRSARSVLPKENKNSTPTNIAEIVNERLDLKQSPNLSTIARLAIESQPDLLKTDGQSILNEFGQIELKNIKLIEFVTYFKIIQ